MPEDLKTDEITSETIQDIADTSTIVEQPVQLNVNDMEIIPESHMITVEELLQQQRQKEELELIKMKDQQLLNEISNVTEASLKDEVIPEVKPAEDKKDTNLNVDETGDNVEAKLMEIKSKVTAHYESKLYEAQAKLASEQKMHEIEKRYLEETIERLAKEKNETQTKRIEVADESVDRYNYLRGQFNSNSEDPRTLENLRKFHLRSAATYYNVEEPELEYAIRIINENRQRSKDNAFGGYETSGGSIGTNYRPPVETSQRRKLNPDLLK